MATEKQSWARRAGQWFAGLSMVDQVIAMLAGTVIGFAVLMTFLRSFGSWPDAIAGILIIGVGVFVYFLPSMVVRGRDTPNRDSVFVINLFLGWTLIGWVVAMAMAVSQADAKKPSTVEQLDASNEKPTPATVATDLRHCPFCAEEIKKAAIVCKHCGRDVEPVS